MALTRDVRESLEILHLVKRGTHDDLQYHAVVWHATLFIVVDIMFSPVAYDTKRLYVVAEVPRHQCVESHGKRAAIAVSLRSTVDVSYVCV